MILNTQSTTAGFCGIDIPDETSINACIHCGMCLPVCPTYRITSMETASPRGRIYLIKAVAEGRMQLTSMVFQEQMSLCLNCRACEAVCPTGVRYGSLVEASRAQLEQARTMPHHAHHATLSPRPHWQRLVRYGIFHHMFVHMYLFRVCATTLAWYQRSGIQWAARHSGALHVVRLHDMEAMLPSMNHHFVVPRGQVYRATTTRRFTVALLTGCIMSTSFAHVHAATIYVLQQNGCDVLLPPDQTCCGALHTHSGDLAGGRELARRNIAAFGAVGTTLDAIIANAAGCGSTLKEYDHLLQHDPAWRERAVHFVSLVQDVHEFLAAIPLNTATLGTLPLRVTYQEPCHLAHAQRITRQPRDLLRAIPGITLVEMAESSLCCGSAGVYNMTQPEMAQQLGIRKVDNALATGADVIATANPGCAIQLHAELARRNTPHVAVRYIVELLAESYRRGAK